MKPGPNLLLCLWVLLATAVLALVLRSVYANDWPDTFLLAIFACGAIAALTIIDGIRVMFEDSLQVRRDLPVSLALGRGNRIHISVHNPLNRQVSGIAAAHQSQSLDCTDATYSFRLQPDTRLEHDYHVTPTERGEVLFGVVELAISSPWRFWVKTQTACDSQTLRVYPDFLTLESLGAGTFEQSVARLGIHLRRQRGEGREFLQLREYREGDTLRQIDWKASSRVCKLVSREYQDENDRDIIFLLDSGRRMRGYDAGIRHFDHALNAMLLTAFFALRQGDGVGVCTFAGNSMWLEPVRHRDGINRLLDQLYDLQATTESTDFLEAVQTLARKRQKRALVVLLTNVQEEDAADLSAAVELLSKKHAVIMANLQENALVRHSDSPIGQFEDALQHCVAEDLLQKRSHILKVLSNKGAWIVDCLPRHLHLRLTTQYLALKRSGAA